MPLPKKEGYKMKRLFTLLLAFCMLLSLLPVGTLAEDACLEDCTEETHAEGCPNASEEEEKICQEGCLLTDTEHEVCQFACTKNAACTLYEGHGDGCVFACLEDCAEGTHAEGCPNAPAPQNSPAPVAEGEEEPTELNMYAKNAFVDDYLDSAHFQPNQPQDLTFYLAQSDDAQLTFNSADGFEASGDNITLECVEANKLRVSMTSNKEENYITYITEDNKEYRFRVWCIGGNGGGQGGGEGGGSPEETTTCTKTTGCMQADGHDGDCVVSQLVARIVDGGYFEDLLVSQQDGWAVYFFLKTGETYTYIEDEENLTATGKATLDRYEMWDKEGKLGYLVGGSGLGTGAITYKGLELDVTCGLYREEGPAILAKNASGNYLELGHFFTQNPQTLQFYLADSPLDEELTLVEFTDTSKFTASGDNITLEYVEANTLKITMTENKNQNYIKYKHNETTEYTFRVWWLGEGAGGNGGNGEDGDGPRTDLLVLDYNDGKKTVPVTVGFSYFFSNVQLTEGGTRVSYDPNNEETAGDLNMPVYLGALVNFGEHEEQAAPKEFYEKISNVKFSLENIVNMDPYGNETPNASLEEENTLKEIGTLDYKTIGNAVLAKANALFNADLVATFTYEGEDHEIRIPFTYDSQMVMLIADDLDTAAKLNAVLASSDDLLEWFESKNKAMYDNYMASNRNSFIDIYLPAVEYTDIIVANPVPDSNEFVHNALRLYGHEDGTSMPGLHIKGNVLAVWDINFEADSSKKMTLDNKSVTCGILAENENMRGGNFVGSVSGCSFTGYDYGICSTETGYVGGVWGSNFINCKNGVYIDCGKGENRVSGDYGEIQESTFVDNARVNTVAVTIRNLPKGVTPYSMVVQGNRFLGCHKDFKITTPGNPHYFYFYNNYYGKATQTFSARSAESRSAQIELGDTADTQKAVVITNPRLVYIDDDKTLGIDSSLQTLVRNDQAASLPISGLEDVTSKIEIGVVVPDSESQGATQIGKWTFNGGK